MSQQDDCMQRHGCRVSLCCADACGPGVHTQPRSQEGEAAVTAQTHRCSIQPTVVSAVQVVLPGWVHLQPRPWPAFPPQCMRQPCSQGLNSCPALLTAPPCSAAGHSPGAQHHRRVPRGGGSRAGPGLHASALPASTEEGSSGERSQAPVSHGPGRRPEAAAGESAGGPRARASHTR